MTVGVISDIVEFVRAAFKPELHPVAREVDQAADQVVIESKKLGRRADAFGEMVKGMRGEPRRQRSGRVPKK